MAAFETKYILPSNSIPNPNTITKTGSNTAVIRRPRNRANLTAVFEAKQALASNSIPNPDTIIRTGSDTAAIRRPRKRSHIINATIKNLGFRKNLKLRSV